MALTDTVIATSESSTPKGSAFSALSVRNYRLFTTGQVISNSGTWMQRIAQDWLVLSLTNSAFSVGIVTALQLGPMLFFGLFGGAIADAHSRRKLLLVTQSTMALLAATLAVLTLSGTVHVQQVYAVALLLGLITCVDNPTRQAFVSEMVPHSFLRSAIGLNSANFQLARVIGPAISGALIVTVGVGWAFAFNALSFIAVIICLLMMRESELSRPPTTERGRGQIRAGLRYITSKPELMWPIILVFFIGTFAMNSAIVFAVFAKDVFDGGAAMFGLFTTLMAVGALLGALLAARFSRRSLSILIGLTAVVGLVQICTAFSPTVAIFIAGIMLFGALVVAFNISANTSVQMASDPSMRGRVMSVYMMAFIGGTPIGGPFIGWITEQYGARAGMAMCGVIPAIAAGVLALVLWLAHRRTPSEVSVATR